MAELMLHKLDVVLAGPTAFSAVGGARLRSHPIGEYALVFHGAPALAARIPGRLRRADHRRRCCPAGIARSGPGLMPGSRPQRVRPRIVGEFEDSALLATFGRTGSGLFPAISLLEREICHQFGALERVGDFTGCARADLRDRGRAPHPASGRQRAGRERRRAAGADRAGLSRRSERRVRALSYSRSHKPEAVATTTQGPEIEGRRFRDHRRDAAQAACGAAAGLGLIAMRPRGCGAFRRREQVHLVA
ncbi:MAG: hypothetical protein R3E48_01630 [Burkholderiaceae bacterium]